MMPTTQSRPESRTDAWTQSKDGTRLQYCHWPVADAKATVAIVPGYAEHLGRYDHVAAFLNEAGLDVFALDLRGHGQSEGARGHAGDYEEYCEDVDAFLAKVRAEASSSTLFLLGHSNGGLIGLSYVNRRQPDLRGLIVTAPFLGPAIEVPAIKLWIGKLLSSLMPKLAMPSGLPAEHLTHDPQVNKAYEDDPLVFSTVTTGWFAAATREIDKTFADAAKITLPCLVMQGSGDLIADPSRAKPLHDALGSTDKKYVEWPGMYHEIMNEVEKEKVLTELREWILERC